MFIDWTSIPRVDNSHQVSPGGNPEDEAGRRRVLLLIARGFALIMMLGGLNILRIYESTAHLVLGLVFIAVGGSVLVHMLWGWTRYVVGVRRERSGRCVHCGYALSGLHSARCPECGRYEA